MEFLQDYHVPVVLGICLALGYIIKNYGDVIDNKHIPLILAVAGVAVNFWIHMAMTPEILLGGLASGLGAVGVHQLVKQERGE